MTARNISKICSVLECLGTRTAHRRLSPEVRFWHNVAITSDRQRCWNWLGSLTNGYGTAWYKGKLWRAHRLAWFLVKGVLPATDLLHSCDNKRCCNPDHSREGTQAENVGEAVERGLWLNGQDHPSSKLTNTELGQIQKLLDAKVSQDRISKQFNVSQITISRIHRGITYKNRTVTNG